jgi:putative ABC transport system permease protein
MLSDVRYTIRMLLKSPGFSPEIGIRMSLGAQRRDVLQLFLTQGMSVTLAGIAIGLGTAWAATRTMLYSVSPTDPRVFLVVALASP